MTNRFFSSVFLYILIENYLGSKMVLMSGINNTPNTAWIRMKDYLHTSRVKPWKSQGPKCFVNTGNVSLNVISKFIVKYCM